jgi:hypothetical protein
VAIEYRVRQVDRKHSRAGLPPIALNIVDGKSVGGFSFTDYLTVEQAFKIAADLTAQAMKVEQQDPSSPQNRRAQGLEPIRPARTHIDHACDDDLPF